MSSVEFQRYRDYFAAMSLEERASWINDNFSYRINGLFRTLFLRTPVMPVLSGLDGHELVDNDFQKEQPAFNGKPAPGVNRPAHRRR